MTSDAERPVVLISVSNEIEASAIVGALAGYGIEAATTGGYISGFKAEAPARVNILVKQSDLDRATQALIEIHEQRADDIDWDSVDVMEGAEEERPPEEPADESVWEPISGRIWLAVGLICTSIALMFVLLGGFAHPVAIGLFVAVLVELALYVLLFWKDQEP